MPTSCIHLQRLGVIAAKITGQPYSLTGHAKDIYTT